MKIPLHVASIRMCAKKVSISVVSIFPSHVFQRLFLKDKSHACYDKRKKNPTKQLSAAYVERNVDFLFRVFFFSLLLMCVMYFAYNYINFRISCISRRAQEDENQLLVE